MARARNWTATINNYTDDDVQSLDNLAVGYIIYGKEVGEENNTPHLQIYIQFLTRMRWRAVANLLPRAHIEVARGSAEQNRTYCSKEGNFTERGDMKRKGERSDLNNIRQDALENGMRSVTRYGNLQQIRVAEKFLKYNEEPRDWQPHVVWIHGPPGCGKTRRAYEMTDDRYVQRASLKWWEGYDGHEDVIIDDFRDDWCDLQSLLALTDRYEYRVECKGSTRQFLARKIIITAPHAPEFYYRHLNENQGQLLRRITSIIELQ